jgi:hypothetical protein
MLVGSVHGKQVEDEPAHEETEETEIKPIPSS